MKVGRKSAAVLQHHRKKKILGHTTLRTHNFKETLFYMKDNTLQVSLQQHLQLNIPRQRIDKLISSQTTGALALSIPIKISREILVSAS